MKPSHKPHSGQAPALELTPEQVCRIRQLKTGPAAYKAALRELSNQQTAALVYGLRRGTDELSRKFRRKWRLRLILTFLCLIPGLTSVLLLLRIDTAAAPALLPVKAAGLIASFLVLCLGLLFALASNCVFAAYLFALVDATG